MTRARILRVTLLAGVVALVTACGPQNRQNSLDPQGESARDINVLTMLSAGMAIAVGIIVAVAVVVVTWRYRRRKDDPDRIPHQTHGNAPVEIGLTVLSGLLLVVLAVPTVAVLQSLSDTDDAVMEIDVVGNQWWWEFTYDLDEDGTADIVTANEMVIPADTEVKLDITSNDVIHSFWIPELNGKKDAVPGQVHDWKIQADEPGMFWGHCAEYCGLSHAVMRMRTIALDQADWEEWVSRQTRPAEMPADDDTPEARGAALFQQNCSTCHVVNGLYETALDPTTVPLQSGVAPNLTHLMSRTSYAGSLFELYFEDGAIDEEQLRSWVLDAPGQKPLAPDNEQGMVSFEGILTRDQIDDIVAFLKTLGDAPILPEGVPITGE